MKETTISSETLFEGRIVQLELQEVELEDGVRSKREIVRHGPAIGVLGFNEDGDVVMVRQYRKPIDQELLEIVAGLVDPGEEVFESAAREVREETGFAVENLRRMGSIWSSAGYCDEEIHLFSADYVDDGSAATPEEDERVEVVVLSQDDFKGMMRRGEIKDSKTAAAWGMWIESLDMQEDGK